MDEEIGGDIERFYDASAERENVRLDRHRTEYAVTWRALRDYLPPTPARVADVGGGPGRYAVELATAGYDLTLVDLSAEALRLAREAAAARNVSIGEYLHASAVDLSALPSETFDAVLLLGPLYHLLAPEERKQALAEARRLLRTGGVLVAAFITRYAMFIDLARRDPVALLRDRQWAESVLASGVHISPHTGFTHAYVAHPSETVPLMEASGFTTLDLIGCEGIVAGHEEAVNALEGEEWDAWVDLNYRLGHDPSIHGASYHLLYVGRV